MKKLEEMDATELKITIRGSQTLRKHEQAGLEKGGKLGKSMAVSSGSLIDNLSSQTYQVLTRFYGELQTINAKFDACNANEADLEKARWVVLQSLADVRNLAGLAFLKIEEETAAWKKTQEACKEILDREAR